MRRRDFLVLAGAATAFPRLAFAQQAAKVPRIAYVSIPQPITYDDGFQKGLADFGYVDGKNISVEHFTAPTLADIPVFAAKAVASKPDIITTSGSPAALAAKAATSTLPIVFSNVSDPLAIGLVASFAHPGGNITGNTLQSPDLANKQVQILKQIVPNLTRLGILDVTDDAAAAPIVAQVHAAAMAQGIEPVDIRLVSTAPDFVAQLQALLTSNVRAVYVPASTYLAGNAANGPLLGSFLDQSRMPAMVGGGANPASVPPLRELIAYGADTSAQIRLSVAFIDAILKGTKPADLPVQQPTTFVLAISLDKAKDMGLTIPQVVLAQATEIVKDGRVE